MRRVVLVLIAALALCSCQGINKTRQQEPVLTYVDWSVMTNRLKSGRTVFSAATETKDGNTGEILYALIVPVSLRDCGVVGPSLGVKFAEPATTTSDIPVTVTVRVDELAPATQHGFLRLKVRETQHLIDLPDFYKDRNLSDQMLKGQSVRFLFRLDGKDWVLRFTLRNHVAAVKQAMGSCEEASHFAPAAPARRQRSDDSDDSRFFH